MDTPTFLEVEVERDAVATALDAVPGVAVLDDESAGSTPAPAEPDEADGPGLTERLGSLWRQWGLLGTGLSLVALGAATVGLWWYRRRNASGTDDESADEYAAEWAADSRDETPPPAGSPVDTPSPTETEAEPTPAPEDHDETPTPDPQETALASEPTPTESDDRRRDTGLETEQPAATGFGAETSADEADEADDERPETKIDPAPLLGAAFLILSSALGRWATRDRDGQP